MFLMQFFASCLCELRLSSLTSKAEGGEGVSLTRLLHDIGEVIKTGQGF
jgi:hypothetical protein